MDGWMHGYTTSTQRMPFPFPSFALLYCFTPSPLHDFFTLIPHRHSRPAVSQCVLAGSFIKPINQSELYVISHKHRPRDRSAVFLIAWAYACPRSMCIQMWITMPPVVTELSRYGVYVYKLLPTQRCTHAKSRD